MLKTAAREANTARPAPAGAAIAAWWQALRKPPQRISLALQGGGAHGAFTWGVLDALLADPRVHFEGLSGSSAGAMNAVVLAHGWVKGGRDGARQALHDFWTAVGQQMPVGMVTQGESDAISLSPASKLLATWAEHFSPAQLNPFDLNPLRDLLAEQVDFAQLRAARPFKLFVGATQANTGKLRVFREHQLTLDMLLASACLPKIHHAVQIDGEPWLSHPGPAGAPPAKAALSHDRLQPARQPAAHGHQAAGSPAVPGAASRAGPSQSERLAGRAFRGGRSALDGGRQAMVCLSAMARWRRPAAAGPVVAAAGRLERAQTSTPRRCLS